MAVIGSPTRDRYFDTLRTIAIVRVIAFHAFPFAVLELIFPSMGVMFALAGSLMVSSIDRSVARALRSRIRRLLPALWVMGLVLVPVMLVHGWPDRPGWPRLLLWVLPIADPPASAFGEPVAGVLWYLVTYLWLVLLSPLLLHLYRRLPMATVLLPLGVLAVLLNHPNALGPTVGWVATNVLTYASCWIIGFAHREGALHRMPAALVWALAVGCVGIGLGWAQTHRDGDGSFDLVGLPLAYAVYSMGFVLVLLRWQPRLSWLPRVPPLNGLVTMVNNRAVTIYLWHNLAITVAVAMDNPLKLWELQPLALEQLADFSLALTLLAVAVLALGWVEDVAARRPASLSPWPVHRLAPRLSNTPLSRSERLDLAPGARPRLGPPVG